jgi:hypothetical protein
MRKRSKHRSAAVLIGKNRRGDFFGTSASLALAKSAVFASYAGA